MQQDLLEKLMVTKLVNKLVAYYGTHKFITVFTRARHWSLILSQMNLVHTFTYYFLDDIIFNIYKVKWYYFRGKILIKSEHLKERITDRNNYSFQHLHEIHLNVMSPSAGSSKSSHCKRIPYQNSVSTSSPS
jgi:hypothetical protein